MKVKHSQHTLQENIWFNDQKAVYHILILMIFPNNAVLMYRLGLIGGKVIYFIFELIYGIISYKIIRGHLWHKETFLLLFFIFDVREMNPMMITKRLIGYHGLGLRFILQEHQGTLLDDGCGQLCCLFHVYHLDALRCNRCRCSAWKKTSPL